MFINKYYLDCKNVIRFSGADTGLVNLVSVTKQREKSKIIKTYFCFLRGTLENTSRHSDSVDVSQSVSRLVSKSVTVVNRKSLCGTIWWFSQFSFRRYESWSHSYHFNSKLNSFNIVIIWGHDFTVVS